MSLFTKVLKSGQFDYSGIHVVCAGYSEFETGQEVTASQVDQEPKCEPECEQIMESALKEAAQIIEQAKQQASRIQLEAQNQAALWQEEARQKGQAEGYRDGQNQALLEAKSLLAEARQITHMSMQKRDEIIASADKDIVELAFTIAGKVIDQEVSLDSTVILRTVRKTLQLVESGRDLVLKVCPADIAVINSSGLLQTEAELRIVEDPSLKPGECILDGCEGRFDATFATQLATLHRKFEVVAGG